MLVAVGGTVTGQDSAGLTFLCPPPIAGTMQHTVALKMVCPASCSELHRIILKHLLRPVIADTSSDPNFTNPERGQDLALQLRLVAAGAELARTRIPVWPKRAVCPRDLAKRHRRCAALID